MKIFKYIVLVHLACYFISCTEESISLGRVEYYPDFLWVNAKTTPVIKKMQFDFSEDAQADPEVFAEFQFVDNEGKPIDTGIMKVEIDGRVLENNHFRISRDVKEKDVVFSFTPDTESGKHQGYLKLVSHKLDRIDSQTLDVGQSVDVFQWTLEYDKVMNPLAKFLLWLVIAILASLFAWFVILRPILYPHFKRFTKSILIEQDGHIVGQMNFSFKGARKVVFSDRKYKQSIWGKFIIGEIKTCISPRFKIPLFFTPNRKDARAYGPGYAVKNPILKSGVSVITHLQQKLKITLR